MSTYPLQTSNLKKQAMSYALIWAFIDIVLFLLVYYVKPDLMASFTYSIISFVIKLGLVIYFSLELRKKIGGYWSFREALTGIFIMFLVSGLITYVFTILFSKVIEPDFTATMVALSERSTSSTLEKLGMDQSAIDKAMVDVKSKLEAQFNPGFKEVAITFGTMVISYFIGALIFAAIFKKTRPVVPGVSGGTEDTTI